jgi:hypothetical protein
MADSCLPPAETGWDFALPTASVKYSIRWDRDNENLKRVEKDDDNSHRQHVLG